MNSVLQLNRRNIIAAVGDVNVFRPCISRGKQTIFDFWFLFSVDRKITLFWNNLLLLKKN